MTGFEYATATPGCIISSRHIRSDHLHPYGSPLQPALRVTLTFNTFPADGQQMTDWLATTPVGLGHQGPKTQNIRVWIGGHELNPAISGRVVELNKPGTQTNTLEISWP